MTSFSGAFALVAFLFLLGMLASAIAGAFFPGLKEEDEEDEP